MQLNQPNKPQLSLTENDEPGASILMSTLTERIHEALVGNTDAPVPCKIVAARLGRPLSTLQRELNPHDEGAKLGADHLLPLLHAAENFEPLVDALADIGYRIEPCQPREPDADSMPEELLQVVAAFEALRIAAQDGDLLAVRRAAMRVYQEAGDVVTRMEREVME